MDRLTKRIFPTTLKIARTELGLTQEEFALQISVASSNISGWEKGKAFPSEKVLDNIVTVHGISKVFLESGEGEVLTFPSKLR